MVGVNSIPNLELRLNFDPIPELEIGIEIGGIENALPFTWWISSKSQYHGLTTLLMVAIRRWNYIFFHENCFIVIKISLNYIANGPNRWLSARLQ